jgi:hypothetical protein
LLFTLVFIAVSIDVIQGANSSSGSSSALAAIQGRPYDCDVSDDYCGDGYAVSLWFGYVCLSCLAAATYILAERYYRALRTMRSTLANFDVANANLGMESDRVMLLGIIDQLFREHDADDRVADLDGASVADAPHPDGGLSPHTGKAHQVAQQVAQLMTSSHHQGQEERLPAQYDQPEAHIPLAGQYADSDGITTQPSNSGLAAFNRSVRTDVFNQLPITGVRSWNVFGYCMAVLVEGSWQLFNFYDAWGFINHGVGYNAYNLINARFEYPDIVARFEYENIGSVFTLAYFAFVMGPFILFFYSAQIKLFLWLHELSGLPRWTIYALFLPLYLFVELVLSFRLLVTQNITNLVVVDLMAGSTYYPGQHVLWYAPFYGSVGTFLQLYHNPDEPMPEWYNGYVWRFDKTVWLDVLLWIFLVVPITIGTYWLYEPMRLQKYRLQLWAFLMQKLFGARDAAMDSQFRRGSRGVDQPRDNN